MKEVIPYLLAALLGAAVCWGLLIGRQDAKVREYDRLLALAAEQTKTSDALLLTSEALRDSLGKRIATLSRPNPALGQAIKDRTLARQEARRALDSAETTSDSLVVVQAALRGAEERERRALVMVAERDRTIGEMRTLALRSDSLATSAIATLTKDRDKWKTLAETAPIRQKGPSRTLVALGTAVVLLLVK